MVHGAQHDLSEMLFACFKFPALGSMIPVLTSGLHLSLLCCRRCALIALMVQGFVTDGWELLFYNAVLEVTGAFRALTVRYVHVTPLVPRISLSSPHSAGRCLHISVEHRALGLGHSLYN